MTPLSRAWHNALFGEHIEWYRRLSQAQYEAMVAWGNRRWPKSP